MGYRDIGVMLIKPLSCGKRRPPGAESTILSGRMVEALIMSEAPLQLLGPHGLRTVAESASLFRTSDPLI
jgi:hypothetical protein